MLDPYQVLGVPREATETEIRRAFRRLAAEHHPDRNPDRPEAQSKFQEINAAYQVLSDPEKRTRYDRFGTERVPGPQTADPEDFLGDILEAFGFRVGDRGDLGAEVSISFEEAVFGCEKEVTYQRLDHCGTCDGSGGDPDAGLAPCDRCGATGRVQLGAGPFGLALERPCPTCNGSGKRARRPCEDCRGRGLAPRRQTLALEIPAGIEDGDSKVVRGAGNRASRHADPGDLSVRVRVAKHSDFTRDGDHVRSRVDVDFLTATRGGSIEVATLHGPRELEVPAGTRHQSQLKLRGLGVPHRYRRGSGDHVFAVDVKIPTRLSDRAREILCELRDELQTATPETESTWGKFKDWFFG